MQECRRAAGGHQRRPAGARGDAGRPGARRRDHRPGAHRGCAGRSGAPLAPSAAPAARARAAKAPAAANPNEVAATLKNGKVVHYDCSKAGNKTKKACGATPK